MTKKVEYRRAELAVHIPDTRGVHVSPWGRGNLKLGQGEGFYTYSKLPGLPSPHGGSCPGATDTCLRVCYAFRVRETPLVWQMWEENTKRGDYVPTLPADAKTVRWHVAGDFDSQRYILNWYYTAQLNWTVAFFGYTRSWRVPELLPGLEALRGLTNVQAFASMDTSTEELPPEGWRHAWLENDPRAQGYRCPEETGRKPNCQSCRYCFDGQKHDVIFLLH